MARPQNTELKDAILRCAWEQFRTRGYDGTSYTSIAETLGISRNLVQYHAPRKATLAIALMERVLAAAQEALGYADEDLSGRFDRIHEVGCCFFGFLMQRGYRRFLTDIIASRELTETMLAFNAAWALPRTGLPLPEGDAHTAVMHSVIVHMGGFYELLYHCLKTGEAMDVPARLAVVVDAFAEALGEDDAQVSPSDGAEAASKAIGLMAL